MYIGFHTWMIIYYIYIYVLRYVYVRIPYFAYITGQPGMLYRAKTFAVFLASSLLSSFFESQLLNHFATIKSCKKTKN